MRNFLVWAVVSMLLTFAAAAQEPGPVAKIYLIKVKPGMEQQFEEAYKQHLEWHRSQNDTWTWDGWQYESGERFGQYVVVTPGHHWSDFDERGEMEQADSADAQKRLTPLIESLTVWWSLARPDLSRFNPEDDMSSTRLARVTEYHVKPGKDYEFVSVVRKANEALSQANWGGPVLWTQDLTGEGGVYSSVQMLPNWAALAPPEKSLFEALEAELGHAETSHMVETFLSCIEGSEAHLVRYRPDLSYQPGGAQ